MNEEMNDGLPYLEGNQKNKYNGSQTSLGTYFLPKKLSMKPALVSFKQEISMYLRDGKAALESNGDLFFGKLEELQGT